MNWINKKGLDIILRKSFSAPLPSYKLVWNRSLVAVDINRVIRNPELEDSETPLIDVVPDFVVGVGRFSKMLGLASVPMIDEAFASYDHSEAGGLNSFDHDFGSSMHIGNFLLYKENWRKYLFIFPVESLVAIKVKYQIDMVL